MIKLELSCYLSNQVKKEIKSNSGGNRRTDLISKINSKIRYLSKYPNEHQFQEKIPKKGKFELFLINRINSQKLQRLQDFILTHTLVIYGTKNWLHRLEL